MHQKLLRDLLAQLPDLQFAYLFGSHASGKARADSDIDIAVQCTAPLPALLRWNTAQELALLWHSDVDLVDCMQASTVLRHQIVQDGVCLYSRGAAAAEFEMTTLSMYQHLQTERASIIEQFKKALGKKHE